MKTSGEFKSDDSSAAAGTVNRFEIRRVRVLTKTATMDCVIYDPEGSVLQFDGSIPA